MAPADNISKKERGKWGEQMAVDHLTAKGYAIVARNWRMQHYEIDIIARDNDQIVFVEVKTRAKDETDPVEAVNKRKRSRMVASGDMFLKIENLPFEYRFDIISVIGKPGDFTLEHIPDAFVPPLKKLNYSFKL